MSRPFPVVSRRGLLGFALVGILAVPHGAWAADPTAVTAPIQALNDALVAVMKAGKWVLAGRASDGQMSVAGASG